MKTFALFCILMFVALCTQAVTWTGASSVDWNTPGNWSTGIVPSSTEPVYIVTGVVNYPDVSTANAFCNLLSLAAGTRLTISSSFSLHAYNYLVCSGNLIISGSGDLIIDYYAYWYSGSTTSVTNLNAQIIVAGSVWFQTGSNFQMDAGVLQLTGALDCSFLNQSNDTRLCFLWIAKTTGHNVEILSTSGYMFTITSGLRVYGGSTLINNSPAAIFLNGYLDDLNTSDLYGLRFNSGTLYLNGNNQNIAVHGPGSYLCHVNRNPAAMNPATLNTGLVLHGNLSVTYGYFNLNGYSLTLTGNVTINGGFLDATSSTITVGGNWSNESGLIYFIEAGSTVVFNSSNHQYCYHDEQFYYLEVNKSAGAFRVDNPETSVVAYYYNWTAGAVDVLAGSLTIYALQDGYIAGGWWLSGGAINLVLDDLDYIDLGGDLHIFAGNFNVYGGAARFPSYWPYNHNASIEMSGGTLDFKDQGVYVTDDYAWTWSENITGGTIRVAQGFEVYRSDFTPVGNIIEFYGSTDTVLYHDAGSSFANLYINKTAARTEDNADIWYNDRRGAHTPLLRTDAITVESTLTINGYLWIQAGRLDCNHHTVNCAGHVYVNTGVLELDTNAILYMASAKNLAVNSGGRLEALGAAGNPATMSCSAGNYYLGIWPGGTLAAAYAVFEKMQAEGVNIHSGALVDPAYAFTNCTFRNGIAGGTLLTLNNDQNLQISNAVFPANTWSGAHNVTKTVDSGIVYFAGWSGAFGGPANEQDTFGHLYWQGTDIPPVTDLSITYVPATGSVRLSWSYGVAVSQFRIYRSTDPYFTPAPSNQIWTVTYPVMEYVTPAGAERYFYIVTAVQ
jgi:hypothetical protein